MSRKAWIGIGVAMVALLAVLFWPAGDDAAEQTWSPLKKKPSGAWTLLQPGLEQIWQGDEFTINGFTRPVDQQAVDALWRVFKSLRSTVEPRRGVSPSDISAWGMTDTSPRLYGAELDLRWSVKDGQFWIYDAQGQNIFRFPGETAERIDGVVKRLDTSSLLTVEADPQRVQIGSVTLRQENLHWWFEDPNRPFADGRVRALLRWVQGLNCSVLVDQMGALPDGTYTEVSIDDQHLRVIQDNDRMWVVVEGLPPQPVTATSKVHFEALVEDFARDIVHDYGQQGSPSALANRVVVDVGAGVNFIIERAGSEDVDPDGDSQWSVRWSGGLETAYPGVGRRFFQALQRMEIGDPMLHETPMSRPPQPTTKAAFTIQLTGTGLPSGSVWLHVNGSRVVTRTHSGSLTALPEWLQDLQPGVAIDPLLIAAIPERIEAIQRAWHQSVENPSFHAQVLRSQSGAWSAIEVSGTDDLPVVGQAQPISAASVLRLATDLVTTRAERVKLSSELADAIRSDDDRRTLAVRIAAVDLEDGAEDQDRLEDTIAREVGLVFREQGGVWQVAEVDGHFVWEVKGEVVERWFAELSSRSVIPLSPSRIRELQITTADGAGYILKLQGDEWRVQIDAGEMLPADQAAVRAYLLELARLEWVRYQKDESPLASGGMVGGLITLISPGFEGILLEKTTLVLGQPDAEGLVPASIDEGRMYLPAQDVQALLPASTAFLPAEVETP